MDLPTCQREKRKRDSPGKFLDTFNDWFLTRRVQVADVKSTDESAGNPPEFPRCVPTFLLQHMHLQKPSNSLYCRSPLADSDRPFRPVSPYSKGTSQRSSQTIRPLARPVPLASQWRMNDFHLLIGGKTQHSTGRLLGVEFTPSSVAPFSLESYTDLCLWPFSFVCVSRLNSINRMLVEALTGFRKDVRCSLDSQGTWFIHKGSSIHLHPLLVWTKRSTTLPDSSHDQ